MTQMIINAMKTQINKYGLELLTGPYKNDLLVHDRAMLERYALPGFKIAWMVGDSHTHLFPLGINQEENDCVTYVTNLSSNDRFFVIDISQSGFDKFTIRELNRTNFEALQYTPIVYSNIGSKSDFWLIKGSDKIGYISLNNVGNSNQLKVDATITPVYGISEQDKSALKCWCCHSCVHLVSSLFVNYTETWAESYHQPIAA